MSPPKEQEMSKLEEALAATSVSVTAEKDGTAVLSDGAISVSIPTEVADAFANGDTAAPTRAFARGEVTFSEGTSLGDVLRFGAPK